MFIFKGFDLTSLGFSGTMALIDGLILSSLKAFQLGWFKWKGVVIISMFIYAFQPLVFLESLNYNGLTVMNLLWGVLSDVVVSSIGLFYFKEKLSKLKKMGIVLSILSIILLTLEEDN
jgi:drug/metabolite transporter (DMT)-like permease